MQGLSIKKNYVALSLIFALAYIVFCSMYIYMSGHVAEKLSHSVGQLENLELIKGITFILVTGLLLGLFSFFFLRRISHQIQQITGQTDLIARQKELIAESEQRALAGTFAASTAHDINNVLGIVTFNVEEILSLTDLSGECKAYAGNVEKAFDMIKDLSQRLMAIGKQKVMNDVSMVDMNEVVRTAVELATHHTRIRPCRVIVDTPPTPLVIRTNPRIVEQCILNLMLNAADAVNSKGKIDIVLLEENGAAVIEVHDDGPGIPITEREKVFEAFYTTKILGSGLGLAGVKVSVELLSGSVIIGDSPLGGAVFRVLLPTAQAI